MRADGRWINHPQHGRQFQADQILCIAPTSLEGLRRYLASGMIRGIGKVMANRIIDRFGNDTLRVIESESQRLEEVEGIGPNRRKKIKSSWIEQKAVRDIMIFLQSYGIGTGQAARIYRRYGADAIAVVKQNPYRLCTDVWGIGFKTADAIALSVGVPRESDVRARAGLSHMLHEMADDGGHCFAIDADLLLQTQALLDIDVEIIAAALNNEIASGILVHEDNRIYLRTLFDAEVRVAKQLLQLMDAPRNFKPIDAEAAIGWAEQKMGLQLAPEQRAALQIAITSKLAIITGGPGVGKTTIIRALTEIFGVRKLKVNLAAPTGRAAKRMSETTGNEAQTLHRLLKYNPSEHAFTYNAVNPMDGDVYIIDETSMIDLRLMDQFLQAVPTKASLILVGDIDQLPSVGPGNLLRDLICSKMIPCQRLTTIFRQDISGLIVRNAHHVNNGEALETRAGDSDFYFIESDDPEKIIAQVVALVTRRIPEKFGFSPITDIQVLTPMRRNSLGAENLNAVIQAACNTSKESFTRGGLHYRVGDRVMQICNNYDKEIFNGDIGRILKIDYENHALVVSFDGRPVAYEQTELDELVHAYACSIHKSQGSEYAAVVLVIHTQHFRLLQRNLLYTAITRGKKLVCVVGSSKAVRIAINNNMVRERRTTLKARLSFNN